MLERITEPYTDRIVIQAQNAINQDYFKLRDVLQQPLTVVAGSDSLLLLLKSCGLSALDYYDQHLHFCP